MKKEIYEVKNSIYVGICIYKNINYLLTEAFDELLIDEDKKYLSLYLGLLNTDNHISKSLNISYHKLNKQIDYDELEHDEYIKLYDKYFFDILRNMDFCSIDSFFELLISKDIVQLFNRILSINTDCIIKKSNKQLVKK